MESINAAVRQMEQIRDWTRAALEPEAVLAEVDCMQALTAVAARMRTLAAQDEPYARLERSLRRAHAVYRANAEHRGLIARMRYRVNGDGGCSIARNYRGAYETSLLLAHLSGAAGRRHAMGHWLRTARHMIDRYVDEMPRPCPRVVPVRDPTALRAHMLMWQRAQRLFDADLTRLEHLFSEACRHIEVAP